MAKTKTLHRLILIPALACGLLSGAASMPAAAGNGGKVDITSDALAFTGDGKRAVFTGHVRARRKDTTLTADKLVVFFRVRKTKDGEEKRKASHFVATGKVKIITSDQTVTGQRAEMDLAKDLLTVTGNVRVTGRDATVRAQKFIHDIRRGVSKMIAETGGRVHGVFSE
ncbi:MAG TPA: hypothetical protein ENK15_05555 [Thermopetrobacter sp.]|nr:hypothetical protein [Thermopetrobacter sp.]